MTLTTVLLAGGALLGGAACARHRATHETAPPSASAVRSRSAEMDGDEPELDDFYRYADDLPYV